MKTVTDKVTTMKPIISMAIAALAAVSLAACGSDQADGGVAKDEVDLAVVAPEPAAKPESSDFDGTVAKPGSPYAISYRIIGTPIVGSPVAIDLQVVSALAPRPMTLDYRINDATSMVFAESQPASVRLELADNERAVEQRVTVIPQREGRFYLNVSASFESDDGTVSTAMAIPIQVGAGGREMQEHGELQQDENGEVVRVLKDDSE
jgi:hypothetical protein